ncbi:hypothetical protein NQZ68_013275 [Dissostichus eleginoides]|nr:hypothetical protein NQZ68_013275 [Dissostichus eleginoides]
MSNCSIKAKAIYASPRPECVSGYKSAANTPDSEPSADFSTVTLDGDGMKVIDRPENNLKKIFQ